MPLGNNPPHEHAQTQADEPSDTYISQTFVIGAFLAIICAQVGVNFLHMRNGRRRRQAMESQFPQPLPQMDRGRNGVPDPGARPGANANSEEVDAGDHREGLTAPGFMHGVG